MPTFSLKIKQGCQSFFRNCVSYCPSEDFLHGILTRVDWSMQALQTRGSSLRSPQAAWAMSTADCCRRRAQMPRATCLPSRSDMASMMASCIRNILQQCALDRTRVRLVRGLREQYGMLIIGYSHDRWKLSAFGQTCCSVATSSHMKRMNGARCASTNAHSMSLVRLQPRALRLQRRRHALQCNSMCIRYITIIFLQRYRSKVCNEALGASR